MADKPLSAVQENAALLEAQGHTREEIAQVVERSVRQVAQWRTKPEYRSRVAELQTASAASLESFVHRARTSLLDQVEKSVRTLGQMLDAENVEGSPLWDVRLEAAKLLLEHAQLVGMAAVPERGAGAQQLNAGTVVIVRDERRPADIVVEG